MGQNLMLVVSCTVRLARHVVAAVELVGVELVGHVGHVELEAQVARRVLSAIRSPVTKLGA